MTTPLIECIPNFSEARRPEVVEAILAAVTSVPGISLLNHSSDVDHNRTVVTFAGAPLAVEEAAFRGIKKAAELIDLDQHSGSAPTPGCHRCGSLRPLSGVEIVECVQLARRLGQRVGSELAIPIYLYEQAATRPDRVNLEDVRRGQYELLKTEIGINPERKPDFGPSYLGTAGATIIGARSPLIAYNVYLTTDDVSVAKSIARAMRHSSGGFRFVKGLGMLVEGRAQVSMNLTDFHLTPVHRVVEAVRREAARYGVAIHHSELVGLIPGEALFDSAAWYLQLDGFTPDQVLENRLYAAGSGTSSGSGFLDSISAGTPTPGGGSAAAYAAAMGAALVAMVCRLTLGKKKYIEVEAQVNEILNYAERLRRELTATVDEDSAAFEAILAAFKLPKDTEEEGAARATAIEQATLVAIRVPLKTADRALKVLALAERCAALGNLNAISDAATAGALAMAAMTGAGYNVRININSLADKHSADPFLAQLESLEAKASRLETDIRKSLVERGGLSLG